jgi:hypothetical protein
MDAPSISCAATRAGRAALHRFERTGEPWCGSTDPETTGNGSIMRLAPVPLFFAQDPVRAVAEAADSSRTTHGAPGAVDACRYLAALIVGAVEGRSKEELLLLLLHFAPDPGLWGAQSLAPPSRGTTRIPPAPSMASWPARSTASRPFRRAGGRSSSLATRWSASLTDCCGPPGMSRPRSARWLITPRMLERSAISRADRRSLDAVRLLRRVPSPSRALLSSGT